MGHDCLNPEVDFPEIVLNLLSVSFKHAYVQEKRGISRL